MRLPSSIAGWAAAVALLSIPFFSVSAQAQTAPAETLPAMTFTKGDLVDPDAAITGYGSATSHGSSFQVPASGSTCLVDGVNVAHDFCGTPPEIKELARALKSDVDLIYEYVHNQVETEFAFGSRKGPIGALIDKSATPFDQNVLFVETAREAGLNARYKIGKVRMTGTQFNNWTGISDIVAACKLLAAGGIPAEFHASGDAPADCSVTGTFDNVTLLHIWSEVQLNGTTWYAFDPSFKTMTSPTAYSQVQSDYGTGQAQAKLEINMGSDDQSAATIPNIRKANTAALNSYLTAQSTTLIGDLKSSKPDKDTDTVLGIGKIVPEYEPAGGWRSGLPYTVIGTPVTITGDIPDQYRTTLTVQFWATDVKRIDRKLYTDEVYGRRVGIDTEFDNDHFTQQGQTSNVVTVPVSLMIDDVRFDRFVCNPPPASDQCPASAAPGVLSLAIDHPYRAANEGGTAGKYADATVVKPVQRELPFAIVLGFGKVSPAMLAKWSNEAADDKALPRGGTPPQPCGPKVGGEPPAVCTEPFLHPAGDFKRQKMAASWLAQFSRMLEIQSALGGVVGQQQHTVGIVAQRYTFQGFHNNPNLENDPNYFGVSNAFSQINVDSWVSVTNRTSTAGKVNAVSRSVALAAATLEGSLFEQMEDLPDVASTASRFGWANSPTADDFAESNQEYGDIPEDPCGAGGRKFYDFSGLTSGQRTPLLVYEGSPSGCAAGASPVIKTVAGIPYGSTQWEGTLDQLLGRYIGAGFKAVASAESFLGPGGRFGPAQVDQACMHNDLPCVLFPYNLPSRQRGGAVVATRLSGGNVAQVAHVFSTTDGISKGGGGQEPERQITYDPKKAADVLKDRFVDKSVALGVDLKTGVPGYTTPSLIKVGTGDEPYALDYRLTFKAAPSGCSPQFGPCTGAPQGGWTHNWDYRFSLSGSGLEAMGQTSPRAGAGSFLAFLAMQDLYGTGGLPDVKKDVFAALVADWWRKQMVGNTATVSQGFSGRQFVHLADDSWLAPIGSPGKLQQFNPRVKYRDACRLQFDTSPANPTSPSRRWDTQADSAANRVHFSLTETDGRVMTFEPWKWNYLPDINNCAIMYGFKVNDLTWPSGPKIQFVTDTPSGAPLVVDPGRVMEVDTLLDGATVTRRLRVASRNSVIGADYQAKSLQPSLAPVVGLVNGQAKDALGNSWKFDYDLGHVRTNNLRQVPFQELAHVYEPVNPNSPALEYLYDRMGRVNHASDATALQWHTRGDYDFYLAEGGRGERDDPQQPTAGKFVVYFDADGNAVRHIDELGREIDSAYDGLHRVASRTYPEGDQDLFGYDDRDNVTSLTRKAKPLSGLADLSISATWNLNYSNPWNGPNAITNARQKTTTFDYYTVGAGKGLLHTVTRPDPDAGGPLAAPVYTYEYTPSGNAGIAAGLLSKETDPTGRVTRRTYDGRGQLTSVIEGDVALDAQHPQLDLTTSYADFTDWGDPQTITHPQVQGVSGLITPVTTDSFDAMRRRTDEEARTVDKNGAIIADAHWDYDGLGRVTTEKHAASLSPLDWAITTTVYTPTGKTWKVTDPDGNTAVTSYDEMDRVIGTADGSGRVTSFTYDAAGQKLTEVRGDGTPARSTYATYAYTDNGKVDWVMDGESNKTDYVYDGFDRLSRTKFPDPADGTPNGADDENLSYDENGNVLTRQTRSDVTITNTYDALDRLTKKLIPASSYAPNRTTQYEYDGAGRRMHIYDTRAGSSAFDLTWDYDAAGRNISATMAGPQWASAQTVTYKLDDGGNRKQLTWPDNYKVDYAFDGLSRMVQASEHTGGAVLANYDYDPLSRRTAFREAGLASPTVSYGWTKAGDLTTLAHDLNGSANDVTFDATNGFDEGHRLTKETVSNALYRWTGTVAGSTAYSPDRLNRYASVGGTGFSYDANANLASDGTWTFGYDPENWLLTAAKTGTSASYLYDPLGRRVKSTVGSGSTVFLHADDEEIGEYGAGGGLQLRYIPGPEIDRPIGWVTSGGAKRFFHADRRGSIIAVTNTSAGVSEGPYSYDAYGAPSATTGTPIKYTGRRYDAETGLYYYRARYYSPGLGRFMQTDPVGYDAGMNLYEYAEDDPIDNDDPTGECLEDACIGEAIAVSAFFGAVISGGTEIAIQVKENGRVTDWDRVGKETAIGLGSGALGGKFGRLGGILFKGGKAAEPIVAGAVSGGSQSALHGSKPADIAKDTVVGGLAGTAGKFAKPLAKGGAANAERNAAQRAVNRAAARGDPEAKLRQSGALTYSQRRPAGSASGVAAQQMTEAGFNAANSCTSDQRCQH